MKNSFTSEKKIITINNTSFSYYEKGTGPTILLIHGWPQTAHIWRKVIPSLSTQFHTLAIELPGMGNLDAPQQYDTKHIAQLLNQFCEALGLSNVHVVGHDIGAWVATSFALHHKDVLKSLTVIDAGIPGCMPEEIFAPANAGKIWQFYFHSIKGMPEQLIEGKEKEYINWFFSNKSVVKESIAESDLEIYYEAYKGKERLANSFSYYQAFAESAVQNKSHLQKIPLPVLAIGGESAQGLHMGTAMSKVSINPVRSVSIKNCGHYVPEEQPEALIEALVAFISGEG